MKRTFKEVMAGADVLRLSDSEKRVLRKVLDAGDPNMAAESIVQAKDSRNLVQATKTLEKYGYVITVPPNLGPEDEPRTIELSEEGQAAADEYDVQNDESLVTPDEKEQGQPPESAQNIEEPAAPEGGGEELQGQGVGLELSSFFKDINDLAKLNS